MVKVDFKSRQSLQKAIERKLSMDSQRCIVEEYKRRTRVIKCANCEKKNGHVYRYCIKEFRCGMCDDKHDTRPCTVTDVNFHHFEGNDKRWQRTVHSTLKKRKKNLVSAECMVNPRPERNGPQAVIYTLSTYVDFQRKADFCSISILSREAQDWFAPARNGDLQEVKQY